MHRFIFADQVFCALPDRALFWPARRALLVADLHLEKASWLAEGGQMLPPHDSHATLTRLAALVRSTSPAEIWALGDSFHDRSGPERLTGAGRALLHDIAQAAPIIWVEGNHDAGSVFPGRVVESAMVDGIRLRHASDPTDPHPEISGHYHPKITVPVRGKRVSRPCIALSETRMILPAFGSLTGGLSVASEPIARALRSPARALVATPQRLLDLAVNLRIDA